MRKGSSVLSALPLVGFALALDGCAPAAEAAYTAQLSSCAENAHSLSESRACRAEVDRKWGIDAGARDQ